MILSKENINLVQDASKIGGKAAQLFQLIEEGYNVPSLVVIPHDTLDGADLESIVHEVQSYFNEYQEATFAVRSSANVEDGNQQSFAGLFESKLHIPMHRLQTAIEEVVASASAARVISYQSSMNVPTEIKMSVIVQVMVDAEVSGVGFGRHPLFPNSDKKVISSVYGLGEGLVSGLLNADTFTVSEEGISSEIADKVEALHKDEGGNVTLHPVAKHKVSIPSLIENQLRELAMILDQLNDARNAAQDIEFAYADEELYLLQARPITTLSPRDEAQKGERTVWDNSNIVESFPGITSPLTFSFIKKMYEVVYMQFSMLLGVEQKEIDENIDIYENMLGHLDGRVYYNLKSWYRNLAMAPGYKLNAPFMEKMMGVKESFTLEESSNPSKSRARWNLMKSAFKTVKAFLTLDRDRKKFTAFVDEKIKNYKSKDYSQMGSHELMANYKEFESVLSKEWKAPLVNDFFAMIFFGVFSKMTAKYTEGNDHIANQLLVGSDDIISVAPMKASIHIAREIEKDAEAKALFSEAPELVWASLVKGTCPQIYSLITNYLDTYGERCLEELKLETITYTQNPVKYIKIIQSYLNSNLDNKGSNSHQMRLEAEEEVFGKLKGSPIKRWMYKYILKTTRSLVSNRENLRFERTRGFGIVRQIFCAMGERLAMENHIATATDIFYLTKEEIFDFIQGTAVDADLKNLIARRKSDYAIYEKQQLPERITTYGTVHGNDFSKVMDIALQSDLKGIGCSPGIIKSKVTVVNDPSDIKDLKNTILVARSTDPGWISLFPTAAAVIVERGSLLSHSAIVARELGIPCIIAVDHLLHTLQTGDTITMNGATGEIEIHQEEPKKEKECIEAEAH